MKGIFLAIGFIFFVSFLPAFAMSPKETTPEDKAEVINFDFGVIPAGEKAARSFFFKKELKSVAASCKCIHAKLVKEDLSSGNAASVLEIEFDSAGYSVGEVYQDILLQDLDGNFIRLQIKAAIE